MGILYTRRSISDRLDLYHGTVKILMDKSSLRLDLLILLDPLHAALPLPRDPGVDWR